MKSKFHSSVKENTSNIEVSLDDFVIPAIVYDFPMMDRVPSGYYYSEIIDVCPRVSNKGKKCVDVVYQLWGFNDKLGDHIIRLSYPEGSQPLQDLYKALLNAGVSPGPNMKSAIGVTERVHLVYDNDDGIGRICKRIYDPRQADYCDEDEEDSEGSNVEGEEEEA